MWRISGDLHWLWTMVGDDSTAFHIDKHRSGDIVDMLLGGYRGHITSDSYSAWNRIGLTHQKCHHISKIKRTINMKNPGPQFKKFAQALKKIIYDS